MYRLIHNPCSHAAQLTPLTDVLISYVSGSKIVPADVSGANAPLPVCLAGGLPLAQALHGHQCLARRGSAGSQSRQAHGGGMQPCELDGGGANLSGLVKTMLPVDG